MTRSSYGLDDLEKIRSPVTIPEATYWDLSKVIRYKKSGMTEYKINKL